MKKILLASVCTIVLLNAKAQVVVDTVSIGAGYANQTWYSLENDEQGSALKNNWDIAFDVSSFGTSVHINSITGTMLWNYPTADTTGWSTFDTSGISGWGLLYNSDTTWAIGAFDASASGSNMFDVGWGIYDLNTHIVTGDSLFAIKLANGNYKKMWIQNLAGSAYTVKYANIDGSNEHIVTLSKTPYNGKNFGYYSLQTDSELDREPVSSANWDLLFTQYTTFIPTAYTVSGVLTNKGVTVAQADGIANVAGYIDWESHEFTGQINEIGYDWKTFTGTSYATGDSLVYFVNSRLGDIWKLVFTGFGGSANGNYIFSKEKLVTSGIEAFDGTQVASMTIYPNPSNGIDVMLVYNLSNTSAITIAKVYDLSGRLISSEQLNGSVGLHYRTLETTGLNPGMYIVALETNGQKIQQRLIVR